MHLSPQACQLLQDAGAETIFMPNPINEDTLIEHRRLARCQR